MTTAQWGILIASCGLAVTLIGVIVRLASSITKLDTTMGLFAKMLDKFEQENKCEHTEMRGKLEEHGGLIAGHETRLRLIEDKPKRRTAG